MATDAVISYTQIVEALKEKIRLGRINAVLSANVQMLTLYWDIGNTIAGQESVKGWGAKIVDQLAKDLRAEFPDFKGLSPRNLRYMRDFATSYPGFPILQDSIAKSETIENEEITILQRSVAKLPWGHNCTILDKLKLPAERLYYAQKAIQNGWTRDILVNQIEGGLYQREGALTNNFSLTLPLYESELATQLFKDPYHFDFLQLGEEARERDLENALISHITKMLLELGEGFAFKGRQYKLEVGGQEYFIDLLFYHTGIRRHIVIELKIGEFLPEYVSKMNLYLGLVDDKLKGEFDEPAIGLILCKTKNKIIAEYALRDTSKPIGIAEYKLAALLPDNIKGELPSIEELEQGLQKELEEIKENLSPVDERMKALKEKLKAIKTDEIQTAATYPILIKLYNEGLRPLYQEILKRLEVFDEDFQSKSFGWNATNFNATSFEQLDAFWSEEENLKKITDISFFYNFFGFKKGGTESHNEHLTLNFEMNEYWYAFILINHNNQQPFLKKLYHQHLSKEDQQKIVELMMGKIMDRMEEKIKEFSNENNS